MPDDEFNALAAAVDADGSGQIDRGEFRAFMKPLMSFTQRHVFSTLASNPHHDTIPGMVLRDCL